jgi:aminoglycoside phosphotransferase (APT) family kinase protein
MTGKDTAPIRPGEEIDLNALDEYLSEHLPPLLGGETIDPEMPLDIEQFPGGHSNLTYLVKIGEHEFVLRRPPVGPVAPTAHDMPREYRLLAAVHPHFPLAPKPYLLCEDSSIIGVPFYLMERRKGLVIRGKLPKEFGDDLSVRRRISETMIDTLAAMHAVDIYSTGIVNIGKPTGFVARQVKGWAERWQRAKTSEVPEFEEVIKWLTDRIPPDPVPGTNPATLVHNDFKLDNVMLDKDDPTRVVAVLDWEMCSVGDPLIDLGLLLSYWGQEGDPKVRYELLGAVTVQPGWMTRQELVDRYAEKTGRDLSGIAFYETFAIFKVAVVLQQIYYRYVNGQTHDERFKDFGHCVVELGKVALDLAKKSGI